MGIFRAPPPEGVRVDTPAGAHYLQYSFDPGLRILNGFIQALNGLYDFAAFANDPQGRALFAAGEARGARSSCRPSTRAPWSLYRPGKESDLGYHKLVRDFLRGPVQSACPTRLSTAPRPTASPRTCASRPLLALRSTFALVRKPAKLVEPVEGLDEAVEDAQAGSEGVLQVVRADRRVDAHALGRRCAEDPQRGARGSK